MTAPETANVARVFVEVADTLVDDFDVIEFLQMVTTHTTQLADAQAAGLLLADPSGSLRFMAASEERAELLELFQVQSTEGPCQDCFSQGIPVINADLREATATWPQFAPRAVSAGFRSVHAFPLRVRTDVIGALNVFGDDVGQLDADNAALLQALADVAAIGLLQARSIRHREVLAEQLQGALNSRIVVEQAKGMIAQVHGVSVDRAFTLLRDHCRRHHLKLGEVARAITTDAVSVQELLPAAAPAPE